MAIVNSSTAFFKQPQCPARTLMAVELITNETGAFVPECEKENLHKQVIGIKLHLRDGAGPHITVQRGALARVPVPLGLGAPAPKNRRRGIFSKR